MKDKYSCFLITVNPNRVARGEKEANEQSIELENAIIKLSENENLKKLIQITDPFGTYKNIKDVNMEYPIEYDKYSTNLRVHTHIKLMIIHDTKVQLNYAFAREFFQEELKLKSIYFNVRCVKTDLNLQSYIQKFMPEKNSTQIV